MSTRQKLCPGCGRPCEVRALHCVDCYKTNRRAAFRATESERFWDRVDATGDCWNWLGTAIRGYGWVKVAGVAYRAHRRSYEMLVGPIPNGLTVDHLCRNPLCVNPAHMELVSLGENSRRGFSPFALNRRKTHCKRGHPFDDQNTRFVPRGRKCKACQRVHKRTYLNRLAARLVAA